MPRKKKATFTPKKKKTLVPEPKWDKLRKAKSEDAKLQAFYDASDYVHYEISDREQLHWLKKWVREVSDWDLHSQTVTLPDVYMLPFAKYGWLAIMLKFMPDNVYESLVKNLKPLLVRADEIKAKTTDESVPFPEDKDDPLHPDKVKKWLSVWKDYLKGIDKYKESKDAKQRMEYQIAQTYVYNMSVYLRTGVWNDSHFGENREKKMMWVVKSLAYNPDGTVKRTPGYYYPDIGMVWKGDFEAEV